MNFAEAPKFGIDESNDAPYTKLKPVSCRVKLRSVPLVKKFMGEMVKQNVKKNISDSKVSMGTDRNIVLLLELYNLVQFLLRTVPISNFGAKLATSCIQPVTFFLKCHH